MSFVAEPYGVFVDDLLSALTGGITREEFRFLGPGETYRLGFADVQPGSVRAHGIAAGAYRRFHDGIDFSVGADGAIIWIEGDPGLPAAGAAWPDRGTRFYVGYERRPEGRPPLALTDRNPGSVTRTLAESFARELAVLSRQLERVYAAGFLDTAEGRDLDRIAELVGVSRLTRLHATGEVVFSRETPAPADIFISEGTRVSTAEAPAVTVETTEDRVLRAGTLSVAAPVAALVEGQAGIASAGSLTVVNRPILGIAAASNPQALTLGGPPESDESLRRRARRALETGGAGTVGAIKGALGSIDGIDDRDILVKEDFLGTPGVVKVTVAATGLDESRARSAAAAIEAVRPAGIRIIHNLPVSPQPAPGPGGDGGSEPGPSPGIGGVADGVFFPIGIRVQVTPTTTNLPGPEKNALKAEVEERVRARIDRLGIGETVVYNRIVAEIMAIETVFDVGLELFPLAAGTGRGNVVPTPADTRARLDQLEVTIGGALIALDVTVAVQRLGLAAGGDSASALADARDEIATRLAEIVAALPGELTQAGLRGALTDTDRYRVLALSYTAEFLEEGLQVRRANTTVVPQPGQRLWIRTVQVTEEVQA